ncbi:Vacuolar protein-sorting-associated protein 25 [Halotydeus destructor]|nr:Vacuolar protein-sorting-associated protein 25 [Halotydeus destructor]
MPEFTFPWEYNFPPFFTLQPNQDTRKAQLDAWRSLVLNYSKHHKVYSMDIKAALNHPLFKNTAINRQLTKEGLSIVLEYLREQGNLDWLDKERTHFLVYWKSPVQWAQLLYAHAVDSGLTNSVCTFYELTQGDDAAGKEFEGLDDQVLIKALQYLEKQGKAVLISHDGSEGVKFL